MAKRLKWKLKCVDLRGYQVSSSVTCEVDLFADRLIRCALHQVLDKTMRKVIAVALLVALAGVAHADWTLDPEASSVSFVSVKNAAVAEAHYFTNLSGDVSKSGEATLTLDKSALETLIPIRNARMVKWLFEPDLFPHARFTASVPVMELQKIEHAASKQHELVGTLALHGVSADITAAVVVTRVGGNAFSVTSQRPVIVNAAQFALEGGIEKLREIAGLSSIAPSVPVSFTLLFRR